MPELVALAVVSKKVRRSTFSLLLLHRISKSDHEGGNSVAEALHERPHALVGKS